MKKALKFNIIFFVLGIFFTFLLINIQVLLLPEPEFHEHANFVLFLDGDKFDFSDSKYMSVEPCIAQNKFELPHFSIFNTAFAHGENGEGDQEGDLRDYIHLHNGIADTIHVHKEGMRYHDFFESLNMNLDDGYFEDDEENVFEDSEGKEFKYFVNNEEVGSITEMEIREGDRVLITFGDVNRSADTINSELVMVPNDACLQSGTCMHRGEKVLPENCGSSTRIPFLLRMINWPDPYE